MKHSIVLVLVMVVALIAGSVLASIVNGRRQALIPDQAALASTPMGGLHKFSADVEWMLFINYMGGIDEVNDKNVDEVTRRLEKLIRLDPNLERVYCDGVSFLAYADPQKTLEFFKEACENKHLGDSADIPFYTGLVMIRNFPQPDYEGAAKYFRMAMGRNSEKFSIAKAGARRYYLTCQAKLYAQKNKVDERLALAEILYAQLKKDNNDNNAGVENAVTRSELLEALRRVQRPETDYTPTKAALDRARAISQNVFADGRLCENCMAAYGPGAKFCTQCGFGVKTWGTCGKCLVVVDGAFCSRCGTKQ